MADETRVAIPGFYRFLQAGRQGLMLRAASF
jgi:hypothetical protein